MIVTLRPHVGIGTDGREITIPHEQIFLGEIRVGYVGLNPGDAMCLIVQVDEKTQLEIERVVENARGLAAKKVSVAPQLADSEEETEADDE